MMLPSQKIDIPWSMMLICQRLWKNLGIWGFSKLHYPEVWWLIIRFPIKTTMLGHPIVCTHTHCWLHPHTSYIYIYIYAYKHGLYCMSLLHQRTRTIDVKQNIQYIIYKGTSIISTNPSRDMSISHSEKLALSHSSSSLTWVLHHSRASGED